MMWLCMRWPCTALGVRIVSVYNVGMYCVGVHSVDVPGIGVHKTKKLFSVKKLIFDAYLRKKANIFLLYVTE